MTSEILVSVVVPVYQVARELPRCLGSIAAQTHENLQVILVDDGSTDGGGELCDRWAAQDPRFTVVHQPNAGLSAARNAGLALVRGAYVTLVDADDWLHPTFVAFLLGRAVADSADIAMCGLVRTHGTELPLPIERHRGLLTGADALTELLGPRHVQFVVACAKLYDRRLKPELDFPVGRLHEDEFTTFRVLAAARRVSTSDVGLYAYLQRPGSIMSALSSARPALDSIEALAERQDFLRRTGRSDLVDLGREQLFRKCLQAWRMEFAKADPALRARLAQQMKELAREPRQGRQSPFGLFMTLRTSAPWLGELGHHAYSVGRGVQRRLNRRRGGP